MASSTSAPWEKYATESGPWEKYGQGEAQVPTEAEAAATPPVAPTQSVGGPLPNTRATRRDAQAQPTVTPAARAADPTNQRIMQGIEGFGTAAGLALPGLEVAEGGTLGWPIVKKVATAIAKPAARSMIGAAAGGYGGREIGGLVGHPEAGEKIGAIAGGLYGGMGGTVPTKAGILKSVLSSGEEAPVIAAPNIPTAELPARIPHVPSEPIMSPNEPAPVAGPLSNRQIGSRIEQGVKEAAGTTPGQPIYPRAARGTVGAQTVGEQPSIEIAGPRIQTPSRNETLTEAMKNRVPGSNPLEAKMPLEEQPISPARTPAQPAEETVHPMTRQHVHVNGARLTEAIKDTPELRDPLLDLEGNQIREVLRKSGEDMSNIQSVGKSAGKAARGGRIADPTNISREEAFDILLDKGYSPQQILKEAPPRSKPAPVRVPFGPPLPKR